MRADQLKTATAPAEHEPSLIGVMPRTTVAGIALVLCSTAVFSLLPLLPPQSSVFIGILALLSGIAWLVRSLPAFHLSLFATLFASTVSILGMGLWPLPLVVSLLVYCLLVAAVPQFRGALFWLRPGILNAATWVVILGITAVSSAALVLWYRLLKPDVSHALAMMPQFPVWGLVLTGAGFAIVNAAVEEFAFRGILMSALESAVGTGWLAVAIQAGSFGLFHIHGVPNGGWGIALSGLYGLLLGGVRHYTRGLLAAWLAHVIADVTIFGILFSLLP